MAIAVVLVALLSALPSVAQAPPSVQAGPPRDKVSTEKKGTASVKGTVVAGRPGADTQA